MGFLDWIRKTRDDVANEGFGPGLRYSLYQLYWGGMRRTTPFFQEGTNIFEKDWDMLIVLDGCRVDAIKQVANEWEFLKDPGLHRSTASTSGEWMQTTFTNDYTEEITETVYVTANPHSKDVREKPFLHFDPVYDYGWDEGTNGYPAPIVTDAAIEAGRTYCDQRERLIVHYMQPHFPSIPDPIGHGRERLDTAWKQLMVGRIDEDRLWESYIANLSYVLEYVELLLKNVDAEVTVISADHGNAKGEWGVYSHPHGLPIDVLRNVPWYRTSAKDRGEYSPKLKDEKTTANDAEIDKRLRALGYRSDTY